MPFYVTPKSLVALYGSDIPPLTVISLDELFAIEMPSYKKRMEIIRELRRRGRYELEGFNATFTLECVP